MAAGVKKGQKNSGQFKVGNRCGGKPSITKDIREAINLSREEFYMTVIEVRRLSYEDLKKENMEKMPLGRRQIISAYAKIDHQAVKILEDRLWGKAKESTEITMPTGFQIVFSNKTKKD